jgi:membrane protease YdiL (CAAX protease family)
MSGAGSSRHTVSPLRSVVLTAIAGAVGLGTDRAADREGWGFSSFGYEVLATGWKVALVALVWIEITRLREESFTVESVGLQSSSLTGAERRRRRRTAIPAIAALLVLAGVVPALIGQSSGDADAYGDVHHAGLVVALVALGIRYPLTAIAEEMLFRGYIQRRLTVAPLVLSGILHASFHWQQASTIPSLIPFSVALSIVVWWTGTVRTSIAVHYATDATFFTLTYLL